jgi:hypothetical protein
MEITGSKSTASRMQVNFLTVPFSLPIPQNPDLLSAHSDESLSLKPGQDSQLQ